ncbi:MAG TPA: HAMP domain-containing sensor histidine kinase, partial [Longimicrobium sp.]|nr:HAMP domain-containing sensor histidine kinase [Longimicrobium sp.]
VFNLKGAMMNVIAPFDLPADLPARMSLSRRSSRLAPGSALLIGLLLLMLGLSSVLAYQALDAARSEARSAERSLHGYAALAHWELSRRGGELLAERLASVAAAAWDADSTPGASRALLDADARVRRAMRWCACPDALEGVFRIDADGRAWTASSRGMRPEVRAAVTALAPLLDADAGDSLRTRDVRIAGARHLLVYRTRRRGDGAARAYGFALDPRRVAGPVMAEVLAGAPLLPATLRPGMSNRTAVAVVLTAESQEVVYRSPAASGRDAHWMDAKVGSTPERVPAGAVVEALGGALAGVTAQVSVRPELAAGGGGGPPESRLPLLLAVFGLTLALFGIAVVQLRRQQELVRLRDDFVSGVSHELRTPLAQIRLFADLLESGRLGDPGQRARSVRIINEESRRLTYLVENILHFSRAQRDASRLSPTPVEMGALVREVVDGFAPLAHDVEFATRVEPGVVARIDRDAFRQVLLNLLDNAAKYGPRGGVVQVGMAMVGFRLRIWVTDGGPGVPREERARIWEPYRRLDREADAAVGGSGIGLAVVKDVVGLHGGRVWVEDAAGGGALFVVEIPGATYAGPPGEEDPVLAADSAEAGAR